MSSSISEQNADISPEERRAISIAIVDQQLALLKNSDEGLAEMHNWKRRQKLRRKYVDGGGVNDEEIILLLKKYDIIVGLEELNDIVPTSKELVWVLGKYFVYCRCTLFEFIMNSYPGDISQITAFRILFYAFFN